MPPRDTGKRKDVDRPGNDGDHPSHNQAHPPLDVLRAEASEGTRLRRVISPGGTSWDLSSMTEERQTRMLTHQVDGTARASGRIRPSNLETILGDPNQHIKGWRREDANQDVHKRAERSVSVAASMRVKYANNSEYAQKERERKATFQREKNATDTEWVQNRKEKSSAYREKRKREKEALELQAGSQEARDVVVGVAGSSTGARESRERRQQEERDAEMARGLAAGQDKEERRQWGARGGGHDRRDRRSEQPEGRSEPRSEQERGQERLGGAQEEQERLRARAEALVAARAEAREREQDDRWLQQNAETIWLDRGNGTPNEPRRTVRVTDGDRRLQRGIRTDEERWGQRGIRTDGDRRRYRRAEGAEIEQYLAWEEQAIQRGRQSSSLGGALGGR
jgi:hypothetical protein